LEWNRGVYKAKSTKSSSVIRRAALVCYPAYFWCKRRTISGQCLGSCDCEEEVALVVGDVKVDLDIGFGLNVDSRQP